MLLQLDFVVRWISTVELTQNFHLFWQEPIRAPVLAKIDVDEDIIRGQKPYWIHKLEDASVKITSWAIGKVTSHIGRGLAWIF